MDPYGRDREGGPEKFLMLCNKREEAAKERTKRRTKAADKAMLLCLGGNKDVLKTINLHKAVDTGKVKLQGKATGKGNVLGKIIQREETGKATAKSKREDGGKPTGLATDADKSLDPGKVLGMDMGRRDPRTTPEPTCQHFEEMQEVEETARRRYNSRNAH